MANKVSSHTRMSLFLQSIQRTIIDEYSYCDADKEIIVLTEKSDEATCNRVEISLKRSNLVYKFDQEVGEGKNRITEPLLFLKPKEPLRAKCDYICFVLDSRKDKEERLYILVINLKSKQKSNAETQLWAGYSFAKYLIESAMRAHNHWHSESKKEFLFSKFETEMKFASFKLILFKNCPAEKPNFITKSNENKNPRIVTKDCDMIHNLSDLIV